ncbi:unnamed protein product [Symbiodinium sp. CCMP2456]|nr:unnamed protein product [Symbiodinium sp. CCMP2456]
MGCGACRAAGAHAPYRQEEVGYSPSNLPKGLWKESRDDRSAHFTNVVANSRPKPTIRNGWTADERPGRARSSDPRSGGYTLGIVLRDGQLDESRIPDTILQLMSKKAPKDRRKVARHASTSPPRRRSNMQEGLQAEAKVCKAAALGGPARETSAFIYPGKMQEDESSRSTLAP